ncbi:MAG: Rrf2 family transcriptional regulator [Candidatus Sumerlaeaceae bacterium]|nr:Rrf2 family transcriptional regulator [Candidatus Sumerlaeaceae bacterium]
MKLTKKAEYAIKAMVALGRNPHGRLTIYSIAAAQKIPKKFLEQILLALKAAGLVTSQAGPHGGYQLARPAANISLGDILQAVNEPLARGYIRPGRRSGVASPLENVLAEIRQCLSQRIHAVSLAELTAQETTPEQVEELMWYI